MKKNPSLLHKITQTATITHSHFRNRNRNRNRNNHNLTVAHFSLTLSWPRPRTSNSITASLLLSPPSSPPISETLTLRRDSCLLFPGKLGFSLSGKSSKAETECTAPFVASVKTILKSKQFRLTRTRTSGLRLIIILPSFSPVSHSKPTLAPL